MSAANASTAGVPKCPFCGGEVDPTGWLRGDGARGPECNDCGATAPSMEVWATRVLDQSLLARKNEQTAPSATKLWVNCAERLPDCTHECTSDHTMVSDSVLVTDSADPTSLGMAHMRADGTWKLYGGDYDFMTPKRITHWSPWPTLLGNQR